MSLFLVELAPDETTQVAVEALIAKASGVLEGTDAEFIESQVTADLAQVFVIVEADSADVFSQVLHDAIAGDAKVTGPDQVRLVGAELEEIKKLKKDAEYLVEWDIPAEITMDQYLARKKANAPKYAQVPEVSFLRTYVREDTAKCLCLYDAPDEDAVTRARQAVDTPIDRLFRLQA